jgi:Family of unknown function (DUF5754)
MKLETIKQSTRRNKKLMITFSNPKTTIHFGSKNSKTFLDHNDKKKRENYILRHKANENWNDPLTAGTLSFYLLWGSSPDLYTNLNTYLKHFNIKY